jgi:hypothetical protein
VFLHVLRVGENIVKIAYGEVVNVTLQAIIDVGLECRWCVRQSEGHNMILELIISGSECSLVLVAFSNRDEVIGSAEV